MPRLIVVAGPDAGRQFPLVGPVVTVGRHSANPVPLGDSRVSRRHFELTVTAVGCTLTDLGSGNGTRVNGQVVASAVLKPGDRVTVGDTVLQYLADDPPAGDRTEVKLESAPHPVAAILRAVPDDAGSRLLANPGGAVTDWLRGRLANLAVLYEASAAVSTVLDVDELLDRIMGLLLPAADADRGAALLFDPETHELMPKAARTRGLGGGPVAVSRSVVEHVLQNRQAVLVSDAQRDERFGTQDSVRRHNIREVICAPMRGRHETVGVIVLDTVSAGPGRFTEDHLQLAVAVAHQAALAVEETRYYQALLNAERLAAVGQTIAALSHHIKNIMHGVRFGSDMVRTAIADGDRDLLAKGWKLVERNQGRIDELIQDMLSYSKEREPTPEPTDLGKLAADVLDVVRGRAAELAVELVYAPPAGQPPVSCDPDGIHRALLNVVANALDATAGRQPARVTVTVDGPTIVVEDTGPGVPAEKAEDIFKPFVSSKGSRGTGLGLPVSRKTLREHGGDLTVEPAAGGGAKFVLRLPG